MRIHHKDRNERIVELYKTGDFTYHQLGLEYNISRERIRNIVHEYLSNNEVENIKRAKRLQRWLKKKPV